MRCPGCGATQKDLLDICASCLLDLRPHKQRIGIPATNSAASYQELLSGDAEVSLPTWKSRAWLIALKSSVNRIRTGTTVKTEIAPPSASSERDPAPESGFIDDEILDEIRVAEEPVPMESPGADEGLQQYTFRAPPPVSIATTILEAPTDLSSTVTDLIVSSTRAAHSELPANRVEDTKIEPFQEHIHLPAVTTEVVLPEIPEYPDGQIYAPAVDEVTTREAIQTTDRAEIISLFRDATCDVVNASSREIDLSLSAPFNSVERERVLLLFDLCVESVVGGELTVPSDAPLLSSDERVVMSPDLQVELDRFEKMIEQGASPKTLREMMSESRRRRYGVALLPQLDAARAVVWQPASAFQRARAAFADWGIAFALAAFTAAQFDRNSVGRILEWLSGESNGCPVPELLTIGALTPLMIVFHLVISYLIFDRSFGERLAKIHLRPFKGSEEPGAIQLITRALMTPSVQASGLGLFQLVTQRHVADWVTRCEPKARAY